MLAGVLYYEDRTETFEKLIVEYYNKFDNLLYFLNRDDSFFQTVGRIEDLDKSKEIDAKIKDFLEKYRIPYKEINAGSACEIIFKDILTMC